MVDHLGGKPATALSGCVLLLILSSGMVGSSAAQAGKAANSKCRPGSNTSTCNAKDTGTTSSAGSNSDPAKPPAAFPFPIEDSKRGGGEGEGSQPVTPPRDLPAMPTSGVPDPPASSERPLQLPPGSSSSSDLPAAGEGSSSSRTTDDDDVAPTTAAPDAPIRSSALKDLGSRGDNSEARARLEQTRVADDLKVGGFYMKDGNTQGAYLRFKDAADRASDDPDVRFNLAEAASRLNKRDEAVLNYREYLRLDAGGDHDKATRRALGKLGATAQ